jgi:3-oxoacyl-[acyl-carrier-protein] synthase I
MRSLAVVASIGARTPLGRDALSTAMLLRTGMPAMSHAPLCDSAGEAITMCFDPTQPPFAGAGERAGALASAALEEALAAWGPATPSLRARVVLCLDAEPNGGGAARGGAVVEALTARSRHLMPESTLEICARGAAGAAFALPGALAALSSHEIDAVVLGGAHSDYDPEAIAELERSGRLFSPQNLDALIPGESAAFAVLTREDVARRVGLEPRARLCAVGSAVDAVRLDNDESAYAAKGLTSAVKQAVEQLGPDERVGWGLCDHTFELHRIREWQAMMTRTHASWGEPLSIDAPAQRIGHLGAAALPLFVVLGAEGFRRGFAPAPILLAFAGSDGGERGAILLGPG